MKLIISSGLTALFVLSAQAVAETAEAPRFLDDQQVTCTGEASVPGYNGPCGTTIG